MMTWIGPAVLAATISVVVPVQIETAAASTSPFAVRASLLSNASSRSTDISARRHVRRYHHSHHAGYRPYRDGYRPYYPRYYARPYYYEPAPFPLGFSFGPFW